MIEFIYKKINTPLSFVKTAVTLVIENPEEFHLAERRILEAFSGSDECFSFVNGLEPINLGKKAILFRDYIDFEGTLKKYAGVMQKKLFSMLSAQSAEVDTVFSKGYSLLKNAVDDFEVPISIVDEWDINGLVKLFCPSFAIGIEDDTLLTKLMDAIDIALEFGSIILAVFVGLRERVSQKDYIELQKHCEYKGVHCLCIESKHYPPIAEETMLVVDKDLCEILVK